MGENREILEDVGRVVPAKVDCGCGFEDFVDAESGREVVSDEGTVEMQVSYQCPECGEEFEEVRDYSEDPTIDPRRLPGYKE